MNKMYMASRGIYGWRLRGYCLLNPLWKIYGWACCLLSSQNAACVRRILQWYVGVTVGNCFRLARNVLFTLRCQYISRLVVVVSRAGFIGVCVCVCVGALSGRKYSSYEGSSNM